MGVSRGGQSASKDLSGPAPVNIGSRSVQSFIIRVTYRSDFWGNQVSGIKFTVPPESTNNSIPLLLYHVFNYGRVFCATAHLFARTSWGFQMLCWLSSTLTHYTGNCQCLMSRTLSGWYHVAWSWHYPHSWTKILELLHLGQKLTPIPKSPVHHLLTEYHCYALRKAYAHNLQQWYFNSLEVMTNSTLF